MHAKKLDLLHVFHGRQTAADLFSVLSFFFIGEIIPCDSVNRAVHIIEAVIDERPYDAGRKVSPFIFDEVPHLVPACLYFILGHIVLEVDIDDCLAVMREGPQIIEPFHVLQRLLERIGHLLGDLLCRCTGPGRRYDGFADGEGRVLTPPQREVGHDPSQEDEKDEEIDNLLVLDRPFRQIDLLHTRTSSSSLRRATPAVTTRSPFLRPEVISTASLP